MLAAIRFESSYKVVEYTTIIMKKATTIECPTSPSIVFKVFFSPDPTMSPARLIENAIIVVTASGILFSPKPISSQYADVKMVAIMITPLSARRLSVFDFISFWRLFHLIVVLIE